MLHKSFKPAKCKTALNLAKSRIKLLKNKKETQIKQLKRELADLLRSGQDQTARIRVEHVVREEKTMAAYELIEIYCELIVARLPIIESQKNCPLDLKEAITSLIFAAPRCGDVPELQDVRKLFTAKYGKEFVAAAVELRPACGVSRIMVEKLSVKAPDGPTKVKILTAIAEEHNIKWEPKWFKDEPEMPSTDLPQAQHTERINAIQMQPLNFEISDDPPERLAREEARSATSSQNHVCADANSSTVTHSASSRADTRFGNSSERGTTSRPFGAAENVSPTSRQNWNMEFKDATSAAQAAAESAERASMAARAAAELSTHGKIINDSSSGPVTSSIYASREGGGVYPGSILQQKNVGRNHTNSFKHMSSRMSGVQHDEIGQGNMKESAEAQTFKEEYTQYGIEGEFGEVKTSSYHAQDARKSRDSLSSPTTSRAESNVFHSPNQEYRNESAENPFQGNSVQKEKQPNSFHRRDSAFDDEYSIFSRQNNCSMNDQGDSSFGNFHQGTATYDDWDVEDAHHSGSYGVTGNIIFREERKKDPFAGSDEQKNVFHFREDVFVSTDRRPNVDVEEMGTHADTGVVFDESGSDDDGDNINHVQESYDLPSPGKSVPKNFLSHEENPRESMHSQSSFSRHPPYGLEVSESFRESPIYAKLSEPVPITFDSDGESSEGEKELRNERIESQQSSKSLRFPSQASVPVSSAEVGMELNFGQLPGGRRNRPLRNPPYARTSGDDPFDASQQTKASFDEIGNPQSPKVTSTSNVETSSTSFDPDVATVPKVSNITARPYSSKIGENMHNTSPKRSAWYFDSDDSGSEDTPKQSSSSKTLLGAGVSRRTKASSQRLVASDNISDDSPSSPVETTQFRSGNADSLKWNNEASSMPRPQTRDTRSKAEGSLFSSVANKSVSPPKGAETPKASSLNERAPSRENSGKNLSHVHPKLPNFETFTAHLQSLRTNRR